MSLTHYIAKYINFYNPFMLLLLITKIACTLKKDTHPLEEVLDRIDNLNNDLLNNLTRYTFKLNHKIDHEFLARVSNDVYKNYIGYRSLLTDIRDTGKCNLTFDMFMNTDFASLYGLISDIITNELTCIHRKRLESVSSSIIDHNLDLSDNYLNAAVDKYSMDVAKVFADLYRKIDNYIEDYSETNVSYRDNDVSKQLTSHVSYDCAAETNSHFDRIEIVQNDEFEIKKEDTTKDYALEMLEKVYINQELNSDGSHADLRTGSSDESISKTKRVSNLSDESVLTYISSTTFPVSPSSNHSSASKRSRIPVPVNPIIMNDLDRKILDTMIPLGGSYSRRARSIIERRVSTRKSFAKRTLKGFLKTSNYNNNTSDAFMLLETKAKGLLMEEDEKVAGYITLIHSIQLIERLSKFYTCVLKVELKPCEQTDEVLERFLKASSDFCIKVQEIFFNKTYIEKE